MRALLTFSQCFSLPIPALQIGQLLLDDPHNEEYTGLYGNLQEVRGLCHRRGLGPLMAPQEDGGTAWWPGMHGCGLLACSLIMMRTLTVNHRRSSS